MLHSLLLPLDSAAAAISAGNARRRTIVVVLDGVDQLHDFQAQLLSSWLPDQLPANVKVLLSLTDAPAVRLLQSRTTANTEAVYQVNTFFCKLL